MTKRRDPRYFAPVPARALVDKDMTDGIMRVLLVVGMHDRLGNSRQGAWPGMARVVELTRLHPDVVRRYLAWLVSHKYLVSEPMAEDKRRRTYHVLYEPEADRAALRSSKSVTSESQVSEKSVTQEPKVCDSANLETAEYQREFGAQESLLEDSAAARPAPKSAGAEHAAVARSARYSAEAAPLPKNSGGRVVFDSNDGAFLRTLESWLRSFDPAEATESIDQLRAWRGRCEEIAHDHDSQTGDGLGGWALRLGEQLHYLIDELEGEPTEPDHQVSTPLAAVNPPAAGPSLRYGPSGDSSALACNGEVVGSGGASEVPPSHQRRSRIRKAAPPLGPKATKRTLDFIAERERAGLTVEDVAGLVNLPPAAVEELDAGHGRWTYPKRRAVRQAIRARREPELLMAIDGGLKDEVARRWYGMPYARLGPCEQRRVLSDIEYRQSRSAAG